MQKRKLYKQLNQHESMKVCKTCKELETDNDTFDECALCSFDSSFELDDEETSFFTTQQLKNSVSVRQ